MYFSIIYIYIYHPSYPAVSEEANRQKVEEAQRLLAIQCADPTQYKFSKTHKPKPPKTPKWSHVRWNKIDESGGIWGQN